MERIKNTSKIIQISIIVLAFVFVLIGIMLMQTAAADAATKPGRPTIKNLQAYDSASITFKLKTVKRVDGYQVKVADKKSFSKNSIWVNGTITAKKVKKWKGGLAVYDILYPYTKFFVKARAYKKSGKKIIYGKWSKIKQVITPCDHSLTTSTPIYTTYERCVCNTCGANLGSWFNGQLHVQSMRRLGKIHYTKSWDEKVVKGYKYTCNICGAEL